MDHIDLPYVTNELKQRPARFSIETCVSFGDSTQLLYLRARFYAPSMSRFLTRDMWIGDYNQPMSYNRWNYTYSNPINRTDPTGMCWISVGGLNVWLPDGATHCLNGNTGTQSSLYSVLSYYLIGACAVMQNSTSAPSATTLPPTTPIVHKVKYIESFGLHLAGNWPESFVTNLWDALRIIGFAKLPRWLSGATATLSLAEIDECPLKEPNNPKNKERLPACYHGLTQPDPNRITFYYKATTNPVINMLHEMGHLVDNIWGDYFTNQLQTTTFYDKYGHALYGWNNGAYTSLPSSGADDVRLTALKASTFRGQDAWQQRDGIAYWEDWADIFSNSMIHNIDQSTVLGKQMNDFFNRMQTLVIGGGL